MVRNLALLIGILVSTPAFAEEPAEPWLRATLVYERGPSFILQNDGEYGAIGTRYDADDVGQRDTLLVTSRTSLELARGRHTLIFLYAPFEVRTQVELDKDLQFRDELFTRGTVVDHRYLFDGYRASYLYGVIDTPELTLELGGSLQIRSADVAFEAADGSQRSHESDIGLVGAAKARLWWRPSANGPWGALEADGFSTFGLFSVKGAIYDTQLMIGYPVTRSLDLYLGARLLGGGADVPSQEIYNWGNFLSFTAGVRFAIARAPREW
jgi:hypothetical protein